jgi:diguanylate cyclase (GGDEF)-like protein
VARPRPGHRPLRPSRARPITQSDVNTVDDMRSEAMADRLLEDSWQSRSRRLPPRELISELVAGGLFAIVAAALLQLPHATAGFQAGVAVLLVAVYVLLAGIEFPVGGGNVVPTQLVLIPMLVLLPPATVPVLVSVGLLLAKLSDWARRQGSLDRALFSIPDAWHAVGPALVLIAAGKRQLDLGDLPLLTAAFVCCCLFDAASAMLRETAARGIAPTLQFRVLALVWAVDACLAPIGFLAAEVAQGSLAATLLVLPLGALLRLLARDRRKRIQQAQDRLEIAVRERARLQAAVRRMGDAFAAKLDLDALVDIMLRGSIEALDADGGLLALAAREPRRLPDDTPSDIADALGAAAEAATAHGAPKQLERAGVWALALRLRAHGVVGVARRARAFEDDELALLAELVGKAEAAAAEILSHETLREQVVSDPLTGLGNRRKLAADALRWLPECATAPRLLMLLDLDGFKAYNDTFGHLAGDALLGRLGAKLNAEVAGRGDAYRLGGDEFCIVLELDSGDIEEAIAAGVEALTESGEQFSIGASYGVVLLPHEAENLEYALQLADERMYAHKHGRFSAAAAQAKDVLMHTMQAKQPALHDHSSEVAELAVAVARRLGMTGEEVDEVGRAAELHDVGKVGIPDAILDKPGPLDPEEWEFMRQHTILGERILSAAPALRPVAQLVRSSHERWDGQGYPDGLRGTAIPRGSRIVAVCDAYEAMTADRPYRAALSTETACAELRATAGTQFDPEVVEAFIHAITDRETTDADSRAPADRPVQAVAERVRALLAHSEVVDRSASPLPDPAGRQP